VLHRCLQFLVRLQYTDANTQHFEEWYRPRLIGGFHASTQDGNLRVDYTQHALSALATYLEDSGG
jgi:vacuolar-type H+-ATPase subunit E/Vma4